MKVVYLLWLHDSVLSVHGSWFGAFFAAAVFRAQPEYRSHTWRMWSDGYRVRWYAGNISRLEVEKREVTR